MSDDYAANTSTTGAVSVGGSATGSIETIGDNDWFRVTLTAGQTYQFRLEAAANGGLNDPYLNLYDSAGNLVASDDDGGGNLNSLLTFTASTGGTYYLGARAYSTGTGNYTVSVNLSTIGFGTISELAEYLISGYWGGDTHSWSKRTITVNITDLTSSEQELVRSALNAYDEVSGLSFTFTGGAADITYYNDGSGEAQTSTDWNRFGNITSATINISSDWSPGTDTYSYMYQTYLHETGHALGLGHQGPYDGSASYGTNNVFINDTWQWSVMSYFPQNEFGGASYDFVITPQMADIKAVELLYGTTLTRSDDTIYGFGSTGGSLYDFSRYSGTPAFTIYDSGGDDTLDCSGYSQDQTIDLNAGNWSSIGGYVNNVGIYLTASIENAVGGSGADYLIGNQVANTLEGNGGNDTLYGGDGTDTAVFHSSRSAYTISRNSDGSIRIAGGASGTDGTDITYDVELFKFSDRTSPYTVSELLPDYLISDPLMTDGGGALVFDHIEDGTLTLQTIGGIGPEWEFAGSGFLLGPNSAGFLLRNIDGAVAVGEVANGTAVFTTVAALGAEWEFAGNADFLGHDQSQFLIRNTGDVIGGALYVGEVVNGTAVFTGIGGIGPEWEFGGNGDFLGDTREEFLIRNTDGSVAVGEVVDDATSFTTIGGLGSEWEFEGVGDFLGHGRDGFLIRNTGDVIGGALSVGEVVNDTLTFTDIGGVGPEWEFVGTGDYIGDTDTDFLMRNTGSGALAIGSVNGTTSFTEISSVGSDWDFHSGNVALLPRPA